MIIYFHLGYSGGERTDILQYVFRLLQTFLYYDSFLISIDKLPFEKQLLLFLCFYFFWKIFFLWNSYLIVRIYCMKENQLQDLCNQTKDFKVLCCWGKEGICWERAILWLNIRLYEQILFKSCSGSRKTEKVMFSPEKKYLQVFDFFEKPKKENDTLVNCKNSLDSQIIPNYLNSKK